MQSSFFTVAVALSMHMTCMGRLRAAVLDSCVLCVGREGAPMCCWPVGGVVSELAGWRQCMVGTLLLLSVSCSVPFEAMSDLCRFLHVTTLCQDNRTVLHRQADWYHNLNLVTELRHSGEDRNQHHNRCCKLPPDSMTLNISSSSLYTSGALLLCEGRTSILSITSALSRPHISFLHSKQQCLLRCTTAAR